MNTHISYENHILRNLFNVCSNYTTFTLQRTRIQNTQFAVYISDKSVTLKQSQDHQTYNHNVQPKQFNNHAKFERSWFNGVWEKANIKFFSHILCHNIIVARWPRSLGEVHWPQIWDLPKIPPGGWHGIKSSTRQNIHRLPHDKSTYMI